MRITIHLDERLLAEAEKYADETGLSGDGDRIRMRVDHDGPGKAGCARTGN